MPWVNSLILMRTSLSFNTVFNWMPESGVCQSCLKKKKKKEKILIDMGVKFKRHNIHILFNRYGCCIQQIWVLYSTDMDVVFKRYCWCDHGIYKSKPESTIKHLVISCAQVVTFLNYYKAEVHIYLACLLLFWHKCYMYVVPVLIILTYQIIS